jgi:hypothetical protein
MVQYSINPNKSNINLSLATLDSWLFELRNQVEEKDKKWEEKFRSLETLLAEKNQVINDLTERLAAAEGKLNGENNSRQQMVNPSVLLNDIVKRNTPVNRAIYKAVQDSEKEIEKKSRNVVIIGLPNPKKAL